MQLIFLIFLNLPLGFFDIVAFMDAVKEIEAVCQISILEDVLK